MKLEDDDMSRVRAVFDLLNKGAANTFPAPMSLSRILDPLVPAKGGSEIVEVGPAVARAFATASIDAWLRAVHSFLVSASVSETSPIWSSVSGYYSSHYAMRALSHLLGFYVLYSHKKIVTLSLNDGQYSCTFASKNGGDREHKTYWKLVKDRAPFRSNPLYASNNSGDEVSDVGHRDRANYADHLAKYYSNFKVLDALETKRRIDQISKAAVTTPPIPKREDFPDLDSVQIVAYHRIVRFRQLLDETLPIKARFWQGNRLPAFASNFMSYQLVEAPGLADTYTSFP